MQGSTADQPSKNTVKGRSTVANPKPFTISAPVKATEIPAKREPAGARDRGPNLFLEPHPESGFPKGYLAKSFEDGDWYDLPVSGGWEQDTIMKGDRKGDTTERLVGDAAEVTRQLREAADALGIGVAIKYFPVIATRGANKGNEVPGQVLIKYLGQQRKQKRTSAE